MLRNGGLPAHVRLLSQRAAIEHQLSQLPKAEGPGFDGRVLVDACWDNPNFWFRLALVRSALNWTPANASGLIGQHRALESRRSLRTFGIGSVAFIRGAVDRSLKATAASLLARTSTPGEILSWELPDQFPPGLLYDFLLKRQRNAVVDLDHPHLREDVAEALAYLEEARRTFANRTFDLVLLSHGIGLPYGAIAWQAVRLRVPAVVLFGNYGVCRFVRIDQPSDIFDIVDRPSREDMRSLSVDQRARFAELGRRYLQRRFAGQTADLGAQFAYGSHAALDRSAICEYFDWDPRLPIVGVYASNWFDFPHSCGMSHFRDFLDWVDQTLGEAQANTNVNWLLKGHPCDAWYGGVTLSELVGERQSRHVRIAPTVWPGSSMLTAIDAVVTYHGTIGVEFAALGKPVLIADRGWYHDLGFAKWPADRQAYLDALSTAWWADMDMARCKELANVFSGWYFGFPTWQQDFRMVDDSEQDAIYDQLPSILRNGDALQREIAAIRDWFYSSAPGYHTWKMRHENAFDC